MQRPGSVSLAGNPGTPLPSLGPSLLGLAEWFCFDCFKEWAWQLPPGRGFEEDHRCTQKYFPIRKTLHLRAGVCQEALSGGQSARLAKLAWLVLSLLPLIFCLLAPLKFLPRRACSEHFSALVMANAW